MNGKIGLEINENKYIAILSLKKPCSEEIAVLPENKNDSRVVIKVFLLKDNEKIFLDTVDFEIPPERTGEPVCLKVNFDGNKLLDINLFLHEELYFNEKLNLKINLNQNYSLFIILLCIITFFSLLILLLNSGIFSGSSNNNIDSIEQNKPPEKMSEIEELNEDIQLEIDNLNSEPNTDTGKVDKIIIYFEPGLAVLTDLSKNKLNELMTILNDKNLTEISIYGHCALYDLEKDQMKLSKDRAGRVYDYLFKMGWNPENQPEILWFGGESPVTNEESEQHLNRRVEIIF